MDTSSSAHGAGVAASSSSSQSSNRWKYEVFLSFRGEDTRKTFTDHLFIALRNAGINTFMDNHLTRGENTQRELDREIEGSRIAFIVFSKRYAESRWCLRELSKIMRCRKDQEGKIVYPIFYDVDSSQVRKQSGSFWEAFQKHERDEDPNEVKQWRKDLKASADLSGWDLATTADWHEGLLIKKIVEDIRGLLKTIDLKQPNCLVGMDIRMKEFSIGYLDIGGLPDVQIIGIWGMGGIGKTTIARTIFNKYQHSFGGQCYLEEVRSKEKRMVSLQEQLLQDILKQPDIKVSSVAEGIKEIEKRLRSMKVLIVVDDIDDADQLDGLAIEHKSFGQGSRIIITTRDRQVLNIKKVDKRYKAQQMTNEEAFELLSWHAFGNPFPDEGYNELARDVVDYCGGLPLALKVVGRLLATEKRKSIWESTLNKLRNIQENDLSYINLREVYYERVTYEFGDDTDDEDYQMCTDDDIVDVAHLVSGQAIIHLMSSIAGLELANVLVTSPPLHQSWDAVQKQKLNTAPDPNAQMALYVTETKHSNTTIISFLTSPVTLHDQQAMVSSLTLKHEYFYSFFEFLCSKNTPSFSVNLLAMKFFGLNFTNLDIWRKKLVDSSKSSRIVITGHSFGGAVATLFTLWLLQSLDLSKAKRPLCITFGSPLVGDEQLRKCVLQFSTWSSCFLNVASINDPVPKVFLTSQASGYKPFGTFLLCSSSGGSCFEDPDAILQLLMETSSLCAQNPVPNSGIQLFDYGKILNDLKTKALSRDVFELVEEDRVPLKAGIQTQLAAILGVLSSQSLQQQQLIQFESLMKKMVTHEHKLAEQKTKVYSSFLLLNQSKMYMAQFEWYKKESKVMEIGYYDRYRNKRYDSDITFEGYKKMLFYYWHDTVTEAANKPQTEGAAMRVRFLFAGTNYRRMIEPLHIADYYKEGGKNYVEERPPHFVLLEQWFKEDEKKKKEKKEREEGENPQLCSASKSNTKAKSVASTLNDDSCFWVHVEEALILCHELAINPLASNPDAKQKLIEFERYVLDMLENFAVTPDIFLPQSSFMGWWYKYKEIVGSSYSSKLTDVMKRGTYLKYADGVSVLA